MEDNIIYEEENDNDSSGPREKIAKLKKKLGQCRKEKEDYLAGWQRAQADLINYKRRQEEQLVEWQKLMGETIINDLLPILDSLEQGSTNKDIRQIKEQFSGILKNYGLEEIKTIGEKFNPEFHEAVEKIQSDNYEENIIIEELQKGYALNEKVIRVAKVKICQK